MQTPTFLLPLIATPGACGDLVIILRYLQEGQPKFCGGRLIRGRDRSRGLFSPVLGGLTRHEFPPCQSTPQAPTHPRTIAKACRPVSRRMNRADVGDDDPTIIVPYDLGAPG
jgi:hypothetical protein